jgi:hypothetical protein
MLSKEPWALLIRNFDNLIEVSKTPRAMQSWDFKYNAPPGHVPLIT